MLCSIQGAMNRLTRTKGRSMRRKTTPEMVTMVANRKPVSEWKVMSPNPRVVMTVMVQ